MPARTAKETEQATSARSALLSERIARKRPRKPRPALGWREWVVFPDFSNIRVKAKIDTGARTSALHAWNIEIVEASGLRTVRFDFYPDASVGAPPVHCTAPLIARRRVRNSGGQTEERYFVRTRVMIGTDIWPIELSLARRDEMGFRMLLGRTALKGRYLVDPGRSYLHGK